MRTSLKKDRKLPRVTDRADGAAAKAVPFILAALGLLTGIDGTLGWLDGESVAVRSLLFLGLCALTVRSALLRGDPMDRPLNALALENIELREELRLTEQRLHNWCVAVAGMAAKIPELQETVETYARLHPMPVVMGVTSTKAPLRVEELVPA